VKFQKKSSLGLEMIRTTIENGIRWGLNKQSNIDKTPKA
jgi:hypothetical protein